MKAFFFDMDGVIFDSMPSHAQAWSEVLTAHGMPFAPEDAYMNEGRTGFSVIREMAEELGITLTDNDIDELYREKSARFAQLNHGFPIPHVTDVLNYIHTHDLATGKEIHGKCPNQIWIVTGSGQHSLFERLNTIFPGIFSPDRMITAYDVKHGKPDPEPYLMAWKRCGLKKEDCTVIENAPLGVRAGHAAGIRTLAVNTGPLPDEILAREGADRVLHDMQELLDLIKETHM